MNQNTNNSEAKRTIIEEGTAFKGDLTSTCPIDVRGRVEGEIEAPSLSVSAAGSVHGRARVGSVRSEGELSGEFEAETIELSGTVKHQTVIRARSLEVRLASPRGQQVVFGDCELSIGDAPTEHDVVEESLAPAHELSPAETLAAASEVSASVEVDAPDAGAAEEQVLHEPAATEVASTSDAEVSVERASSDGDDDSAASVPSGDAAAASGDIDADEIVEEPSGNLDGALYDAPSSLEEAFAAEAGQGKSKKGKGGDKKQQDNGAAAGAENTSGWTSPPSQPPPGE
jgi:cytoskeletal protein CcmA (bactofilin family)